MKKEIPKDRATYLINHGPTVLLTVYENNPNKKTAANIIALAWQMPVSHEPKLLAVSISPLRFSHKLINEAGEFIINIPHKKLIKEVHLCGTTSGRDTDKFALAKFTPMPSPHLKTPLIKECLGHLECRLVKTIELGDHTLFLGEVIGVLVDEEYFDKYWKTDLESFSTLHHLGGDIYTFSGGRREIKR